MALFTWDKSDSVNIPELDRQHQYLFALVNHLHEAMVVRQGRLMVASVLDELAEYAKSHCAAEETHMRAIAFPGFREHQEEHASFMKKVAALKAQYEQGRTEISLEIMDLLEDWLKHHVRNVDRKFAPPVPLPPLPPDYR